MLACRGLEVFSILPVSLRVLLPVLHSIQSVKAWSDTQEMSLITLMNHVLRLPDGAQASWCESHLSISSLIVERATFRLYN
jgi:hypothetical protein